MNSYCRSRFVRLTAAAAFLIQCLSFPAWADEGSVETESSIGYPSATVCDSADLPDESPGTPPGHWFNPDRTGQGWDITHWTAPVQGGEGYETRIKLTWFTYKSDRRPLWLESDIQPMISGQRWSSTLYKVRNVDGVINRQEIGEAAFRLVGDPRKIAIRWRRDDLIGNPTIDECIFDIFRTTPIDEAVAVRTEGASLMLSGVWEEVVNPGHRAVHVQKGRINDNGNWLDAEIVMPLLFDSTGEPVWLYGQYGPAAAMPSDYTYGVAPNNPGDPLNFVYNYLNYGPNGTSGPETACAGIATCVKRIRPKSGLFQLNRKFTANTHPNGPAPARIEIGNTDGGSVDIPLPIGTHTLKGWRRPDNGGTVQIRKVNTYASVQVDRYQCDVSDPPDPATCDISVGWTAGIAPDASVWRYTVANGTQTRISGANAWGELIDKLQAGARVRYRIRVGTAAEGELLAESPDVRAYGIIADDPIVPLGVPNHDPTVGAVAGTPGVAGGAATYTIPIQVPPGRNGMAPELSLAYSSRAGNGIAGMGWSLSGLSSVHRCPGTIDQDNRSTAVNYSLNDRLCLDGRRLMLVVGAYGKANATYRTEIDDFARVTQLGDSIAPGTGTYFKVEHKSGLIDWYGSAPDNADLGGDGGVQTAPGAPGPLTWARVRREDRDGNFIRYRYSVNALFTGHGEFLLAGISYTGKGTTEGTRLIEFNYENRNAGGGNDYGSSYLAGGLNMQMHRLIRITAYAPGAVKARQYNLGYGGASTYSKRSLLRSVQECGFDGGVARCKDITQFGWQDAAPSFVFKPIDFTGLPLPDPIEMGIPANPTDPVRSTLDDLWREQLPASERQVFDESDDYVLPASMTAKSLVRDFRPFADMDGDGTLEWYARIRTGGQYASYLVQMNADREIEGVYNVTGISGLYSGTYVGMHRADMNNDGRTELAGHANGKMVFGFWNDANKQIDAFTSSIPHEPDTFDVRLLDFNADGKPDVLMNVGAAVVTSPAHSCPAPSRVLVLYRNTTADAATTQLSFSTQPQFVDCLAATGLPGNSHEKIEHIGDFDGNGLPDIYVLRPLVGQKEAGDELKRAMLTTQSDASTIGFEARQAAQLGMDLDNADLRRLARNIVRWADINGDGLDDLLIGDTSWKIRFNRGGAAGLGSRIDTGANQGLAVAMGLSQFSPQRYSNIIRTDDIDGDGRTDLLVPNGFALRMCVKSIYQNEGLQWNAWACPEHPAMAAEPDIPPFGYAYTQWMYKNGLGAFDESIYTMSAQRFVQTSAQTVALATIPTGHLVSGISGDLYGDGLGDQITFAGCSFSGNDACAVMPGSPAALPNGDPTAPFAQQANRKHYVSENQGAGSRGANLPPKTPEVMEIATDGLGREAVWNYFPLSSDAGRLPGLPSELAFYSIPDRISGDSYIDAKHFYFSSSMNAVESLAVSNGVGGESFTSYSYVEAVYNNRGRGFQGFRSIVEDVAHDGATPMRTTSTFHQKYPLAGLVERSELRTRSENPFTPNTPPIEATDTTWLTLDTGGGRRHPYLKRSIRTLNDPVAPRTTHTTVTQRVGSAAMADNVNCTNLAGAGDGIDCAGNVALQTTTTVDAFATRTQTATNVYAAHDTTTWWLNRPATTTQTASVAWSQAPMPAGSTSKTLTTDYGYGTYLAQRRPDWIKQTSSGDGYWRQTRYTYDAWGNTTSEALFGSLTPEASSLLSTRNYTGSDGYFPSVTSNALGHATTAAFDARFGAATSVTDPNGLITSTVLDAFGLPIQITAPGVPKHYTGVQRCGGPYSCTGITHARYRIETRQDGTPIAIAYHDMLNREVGRDVRGLQSEGKTVRTRTEYLARGLVHRTSTPHFTTGTPYWTSYGYDLVGRATSTSTPTASGASRTTTYAYAGLTTTIKATAPNATHGLLLMSRTHNAAGQLLSTADALGGTTHYRYDGLGHAILIRDAGGADLTASYNALGDRLTMTDPDRGAWSFQVTADGQPLVISDARPAGRHITYDRLGRPTAEYEDRAPIDGWTLLNGWTWDTVKKGQLSEQRHYVHGQAQHVRTYSYDALSRPISEKVTIKETQHADQPWHVVSNPYWLSVMFERKLGYDGYYGWVKSQYHGVDPAAGHAVQSATGSMTQVWRRDAYGYVIKDGFPTDDDTTMGYRLHGQDAWGRAAQATLGNGLVASAVTTPATGQVDRLCVGVSTVSCGTLDLDYSYDGWGNVTSHTQGTPLAGESFGYDPLQRLVSSQRTGAPAVTLDYHPNGNLKHKSDYSVANATGYQYGTRPHAVTQVNGADTLKRCYTYDGAGNQTGHQTGPICSAVERTVTYEIGHRPETVTGGQAYGWTRLLFRYDGNGERYVQRQQPYNSPTVDTKVTLYPFPGFEVEVTKVGSQGWAPVMGRQRLGDWGLWTASAMQPQGERLYWHGDRLGSPAAKSGSTGVTLERHGFDAWGSGRTDTWTPRPYGRLGSTHSPRGFTGHEHLDAVGGLIHMNGRAYDPNLGRFLSVDPVIQFPANSQSLNPYSYIMNNPMAGTDPTGYVSDCAVSENSNCTSGLEPGQTKQVRTTEVGSRISKATGTITNNGGGSITVSALGGGSITITGVGGNGASNAGAGSGAKAPSVADRQPAGATAPTTLGDSSNSSPSFANIAGSFSNSGDNEADEMFRQYNALQDVLWERALDNPEGVLDLSGEEFKVMVDWIGYQTAMKPRFPIGSDLFNKQFGKHDTFLYNDQILTQRQFNVGGRVVAEGGHINYFAVGMLAAHYGPNVKQLLPAMVTAHNAKQISQREGWRNMKDIGPGIKWALIGAALYDRRSRP
jgi:RHS repeat-associated protein